MSETGEVLLVGHFFHPVHDLAACVAFLDGDMAHGGRRRGAMPVLHARRTPDHVAGPDFHDRPTPALRPANAGRHDQRLAEGMRVPVAAGAWLEGDEHAGRARCR